MEGRELRSELKSLSQVLLVSVDTIFSILLIALNRILKWEAWILPIFMIGVLVCWLIHIGKRGTARIRIYIYALFGIFELFYYIVNINSIFDSSALIIVSLILLSMTEERAIILLDFLMGYIGMFLNLIINGTFGEIKGDYQLMVRIAAEFLVVFIATALAELLIRAWVDSESLYKDKIDELIKENELANKFLANVSHEIRTPVNAVIGLSTVLDSETLPPRITENIEAIQSAGHRLGDQIGDILDFTELDMNKLAINEETYMVTSLVNDLLTQLSIKEKSALELVINLEPDTPAELIGDPMKLKKILWHLISNGMKFTDTGGVYAHIYSNKRDYGINLVFEITDTGIGMTDDELENIYNKYYQADSGKERAVGGLGLGIPIVNGFTQCMGGFLSINSVVGEGTVIRVSIPQKVHSHEPGISVINPASLCCVAFMGYEMIRDPRVREFYDDMIYDFVTKQNIPFHRVTKLEELEKLITSYRITHLFVGPNEYLAEKDYLDALAVEMTVSVIGPEAIRRELNKEVNFIPKPLYGGNLAKVLNSYFEEGNTLENLGRLTFPGIKALVVDDEPMNLMVARGIFESYGMIVDTALSGYESVEMCDAGDYDIVFMDHMMPGMDGIEAMKRIRISLSKLKKEVYMIALTANAISTAKDMFMAEGFDGFVPKPVETAELERVLKHVLPRTSYTYEAEEKENIAYKDLELQNYNSMDEAYSRADEELNESLYRDKKDDKYNDLRSLSVNITAGLRYCKNDRDFYDELLMEFARDRKHKEEELESYFNAGNWDEYKIRIHAVKSTSKMIGAAYLFEKAKLLEDAAGEKDTETLIKEHPDFMPRYVQLMDIIGNMFDEADDPFADSDALEFVPKEQ